MSRPDRVVLVSDAVELGGAEVSLIDLARSLGDGHDVVCLIGERAPAELHLRLEEAGVAVERVTGLRRRPTPAGVRGLVRRIRGIGPDIVHLNLTDQGDLLTALLGSRRWSYPTVATLRCVVPSRAGWRERVSAIALGRVDLAIGASGYVRDYLDGLGLHAIEIPNGVPQPEREPLARAELGVADDQFVVGGIGRLHESKGWDVLARAAGSVKEALPHAAFVVVGEGAQRRSLERVAGANTVRFVGYRPSAPALISGFDVLVVPSRFEAFGRAAAEAMLAGVPVIASNVGGLPEVIGDCGILVPPERPDLLAQEIVRLGENPVLAADLAKRARARAVDRFGMDRMLRDTVAAYAQVRHAT